MIDSPINANRTPFIWVASFTKRFNILPVEFLSQNI